MAGKISPGFFDFYLYWEILINKNGQENIEKQAQTHGDGQSNQNYENKNEDEDNVLGCKHQSNRNSGQGENNQIRNSDDNRIIQNTGPDFFQEEGDILFVLMGADPFDI